jgi:hypothetical protein
VVAFAAAQDFVVASVIWFNLTSQANEFCLIEGAPTFAIDSCDGLTALSIVWATSQ